jgi:hypothetical protein
MPNGFRFIFPQLPNAKPPRGASFAKLCDWVEGIIRGNKFLAEKHHWPQTREAVENWVEDYNARVCLSMGWNEYVSEGGSPQVAIPFPVAPPQRNQSGGGGAADHARNTIAGAGVIADWLGAGLRPVDKPLAEKRAAVCAVCPQNQPAEGFFQKLDALAAKEIKRLIEVKNELELVTSQDAKLGACAACDCALGLKTWANLNHILAHTSDKVKAKLDPKCWILAADK